MAPSIIWTDYLRYRAQLRDFDLDLIASILRMTDERYYDSTTGRRIAIGQHRDALVMIPYDADGSAITPVTIHATTRQQIRFRLRTGRFRYE